MDVVEKYGIKKFYAYHQQQKSKDTIEFGWVEVKEIPLNQKVVLSLSEENPESNNMVSLSDYKTYFTKLNALEPLDFIKRWSPSPKELELYWSSNMPTSEKDLDKFMMNLAYLIEEEKSFTFPFEKYSVTFEVLDLGKENEERNKAGEVQEEV